MIFSADALSSVPFSAVPDSGAVTLVIEAATIAAGIAPGLYRARRKAHGFSKFRDCDHGLFERLVAELEARVRQPAGGFQASDLDPQAVAAPARSQDRLPGLRGMKVAGQQASLLGIGLAASQGLRGATRALAGIRFGCRQERR